MDKATVERKGYSVPALRALARTELPRMLFDMVDGAAGDEITMRNNESALAALELVPTLLAGAPTRDQSVELFGETLTSPVIIGPTGLAGLLWPHAELAAARAAARFGTIYSTSHASIVEPRGDRRRDPRAEMDADVPLQGPRPHRGIRRPRGRRRYTGRSSSPSTTRWWRGATATRAAGRSSRCAGVCAASPTSPAIRRWLMRMRETPSPTFANYGAPLGARRLRAADGRSSSIRTSAGATSTGCETCGAGR